MIKPSFLCLVVLLACATSYSQDSLAIEEPIFPMGRFAGSINYGGAVLFGPMINADVRLVDQLWLNTHVRFPTAGFTYALMTTSSMWRKGVAGGGGIVYFFGKQKSKPYLGLILEYQQTETKYWGQNDLYWIETDKNIVLSLNGGFRFRYRSGFYFNLGGFLFISKGRNENGTSIEQFIPLPNADITLGFEFGSR